jgi:hypothetical protein
MWQTARDLLKYVYLHVRQYWASYSISTSLFLIALQIALDELRAITPGTRNWSHSKELFASLLTNEKGVLKIKTNHPIDRVDKFYYWPMIPLDGTLDICDCPDNPMELNNEHIYIPCRRCCFDVPSDPSLIEMKQVHAQNNLMSWEYQISGSSVAGMWWHYWQIVTAKLPECTKDPTTYWIYMTYRRWPQIIESFDDEIMVPRQYFHLLALICAKYLLPIVWASRTNVEDYFDSKIDQLVKQLKEKDSVYPTGFINKSV